MNKKIEKKPVASQPRQDPRLVELDEHIAAAKAGRAEREAEEEAELSAATQRSFAFATAFRMSFEVVGGVMIGAIIGLLIDWALKTSPWGLSIFLLLGFAAGVLNLVRQARARSLAEASSKDLPRS